MSLDLKTSLHQYISLYSLILPELFYFNFLHLSGYLDTVEFLASLIWEASFKTSVLPYLELSKRSFLSTIWGVRCFSWLWRALWHLLLNFNLKGQILYLVSLNLPWWETEKLSSQDLSIFINVSSHPSSIVFYSQSLENNFPVNIRPLQLSLMLSALTYTLSINSLN